MRKLFVSFLILGSILPTVVKADAVNPNAGEACETVKRMKTKMSVDPHFMAVATAASSVITGFALEKAGKALGNYTEKLAMIDGMKDATVKAAKEARLLSKVKYAQLQSTLNDFLIAELEALFRKNGPDALKIGNELSERLPKLGAQLADDLTRTVGIPRLDATPIATKLLQAMHGKDLAQQLSEKVYGMRFYNFGDMPFGWERKASFWLGNEALTEVQKNSKRIERVLYDLAKTEINQQCIVIAKSYVKNGGLRAAAKCLKTGGKLLKIAGPFFGIAMEIIFANKAYAETLTSAYSQHPESLLVENTEEQACEFLKSQNAGSVPERIIVLGALIDETYDELDGAGASEMCTGDETPTIMDSSPDQNKTVSLDQDMLGDCSSLEQSCEGDAQQFD